MVTPAIWSVILHTCARRTIDGLLVAALVRGQPGDCHCDRLEGSMRHRSAKTTIRSGPRAGRGKGHMKAIMFRRTLHREVSLLLAIPIALLSVIVGCVPAAAAPGVDPQTLSAALVEGTNVSVSKTVHTPTIPPTPDIIFLSDTTGSMGGVIAGVQARITSVAHQILAAQPQAQFAVAQYKDQVNCSSDPFAFKLDQALTTNLSAVQSAVNTWSAGGGCDEPESDLFALDQIATSPAIGFRSDSTRIIVWFGDAPSHDEIHPNSPVTLAQTIADLQAAKIEVLAVPFNHGGLGLDGFGQASQVTAATAGVLLPSQ